MPYVLVDDAAATLEKAKSLGATVVKELSEVPGMGWFGVFVDPTGAGIAVWQPRM